MQEAVTGPAKQERRSYNRKSAVRYSAHCPGVIELTFVNKKLYIALTGAIVNVSVTGCLFSNGKTPWSTIDLDKAGEQAHDLIDEDCLIHIPWANLHQRGKVRRVGAYIVGVEFARPISPDMVATIARLEPGAHRSFRPKDASRYNRILPFARK